MEEDPAVTTGTHPHQRPVNLTVMDTSDEGWALMFPIDQWDSPSGPDESALLDGIMAELNLPPVSEIRNERDSSKTFSEKSLTEWLDDPHTNSRGEVSIVREIEVAWTGNEYVVTIPDEITVHC